MTELSPERRDLVLALLDLSADRQHLLAALKAFPWDSDDAVEFEPWMLRFALEKTIRGEHSVEELAQWADDLEMREDVAMTDPRVREIIYLLATPELEGEPAAVQLRAWLSALGGDDSH